MKNKIILIAALSLFIFMVSDILSNYAISKITGAPEGSTGSPANGGTPACASGYCHGGTATVQQGWITSDVPAEGYLSGNTYTITATVNHATKNTFGFQISPQNASGNLLGTLTALKNSETQLAGSGKYITHKQEGINGINNSKSWQFSWTAPPAGTGEVTFYGAFNTANGDATQSGDEIHTSTLTIQENPLSSVQAKPSFAAFKLFPNPVSDKLNIYSFSNSIISFTIISVDGKILMEKEINSSSASVDLSFLSAGLYFFTMNIEGKQIIEQIVKF